MRHPGKAAWYAGALAVFVVMGAVAPARAVDGVRPAFFAPGLLAHRPHRGVCDGGPVCSPGGPVYYYPIYAPAPPVELYPAYGAAPPGYYYPEYGPAPPEGHVAPCHDGPPPLVVEPPPTVVPAP